MTIQISLQYSPCPVIALQFTDLSVAEGFSLIIIFYPLLLDNIPQCIALG